jgi:aminopeptidase N
MKKYAVPLSLLAAVLLSPVLGVSSHDESIFDRIRREHQEIRKEHCARQKPAAAEPDFVATAQPASRQPLDVEHYRLQITLDPDRRAVSGVVTINIQATAPLAAVTVDAAENLAIDSVRLSAHQIQFQRSGGRLVIPTGRTYVAGERFDVVIAYNGPAVTGGRFGGGMLVGTHGNGATVMANLSEPFASPTWWPCIDDPRDKATIECEATVPQGYEVASNGLLGQTVANSDQTVTYFWRSNYQLATYLVSVAATNYAKFEDSYTALDGVTTMPIVYYVYPEHLDLARQKFAVTRLAMEIFAPLFGEYPFLNEKYGMAEFPWGGAMEHQTMTSMGQNIVGSATSSGAGVIAHELAHHWWGNLVTMRTWDDIWLNEGFATYSEVLFFERHFPIDPGLLMSASYDDGLVSGELGGTVTAENQDDPFDDRGAIYTKGAWVLHMARGILGDRKFFDALNDYRARHAFGNASTADLREAFERQYGQPLDWFFHQWVYAPGRPSYKHSAVISGPDSSGNYSIRVTLKQKQSVAIPGREKSVFIMPLDLTIHHADGSAITQTVFNNQRKQKFTLTTSRRPVSVGLDEGNWVLKKGR